MFSWPQGREQQRILHECMRVGAEEDRKFREGRLGRRRSREWDIGGRDIEEQRVGERV